MPPFSCRHFIQPGTAVSFGGTEQLTNPNDPDSETKVDLAEVEVAARKVGQELSVLNAGSARDFEPAFTAMSQQGAGALLIMSDPLFFTQRAPLIALADRYAISAIYEWREFAAEGGLMSYGSSLPDAYRQLGIYTGKILRVCPDTLGRITKFSKHEPN